MTPPSAHETVDTPTSRERGNGHVQYRPPATDGPSSTHTLASIWRHPFLILLPTILLLAAGIYVGDKKHPTYSATATINVGKSDINTQATPGYLQASEALASTYSRLVNSQHVEVPAARSLGQSATTFGSAVTSTPIPNEPTFTITANGPSPTAAVKRARATVRALQGFVAHSATQQGSASQLIARYERAQAKADALQLKSSTLQARRSLRQSTNLPGGPSASDVAAAKVAGQVASLKAQALSGAYLNLAQNGSAPTLDVLIDPTSTSSNNRTSNIEKYGVIGGVAGLAIGLALAALVTALQTKRRSRLSAST